jgi:hypothetical protein
MEQHEPHQINAAGQCPRCLRKPLAYKRDGGFLFCPRCDRRYNPETGEQINSFGWAWRGERYVARFPEQDYAKVPMEEPRRSL